MWSIHTMGYYSSIKRTEVLIHPTRWMNLDSGDENVLELDRAVMVAQRCEYTKHHRIVYFNTVPSMVCK